MVLMVAIVIFLTGIRIAQEYERGIVFRLGRFLGLRGPGLYWIVPLGIERSVTIDIRTRTVSAEQQESITRDSVTIKVNAVLWYRVVDAAKSVIAVRDVEAAVYQLALTSLQLAAKPSRSGCIAQRRWRARPDHSVGGYRRAVLGTGGACGA